MKKSSKAEPEKCNTKMCTGVVLDKEKVQAKLVTDEGTKSFYVYWKNDNAFYGPDWPQHLNVKQQLVASAGAHEHKLYPTNVSNT